MNKPKQKQDAETLRANEEKWGETLMAAGWSALPNIIIKKQHALGLDALDINILLHLQVYWWKADNAPHPSKSRIAAALGVSARTIQRRITAMQKDGLITRTERFEKAGGQTTNRYSFEGLIEHATPFAEEEIQLRQAQKVERDNVTARKRKPALVGISGSKNGGSK